MALNTYLDKPSTYKPTAEDMARHEEHLRHVREGLEAMLAQHQISVEHVGRPA